MTRTISVVLHASVAGYRAELGQAAAATRAFGNDVSTHAGKGDKALRQVGVTAVAVGASIVAALGAGGFAAVGFEARMRNVATVNDDVRKSFAASSREVLALTQRLPQSANQLAEGLYDIASAGFQGGAGLKVLTASATAASAGLTSTQVAARAIAGVLNAYGLSAAHAADVSDALFQTVNLGVVTFEELSGTIGDFVGITSAAGISIGDAGAALAAMTLSGVTAAEAGTSLGRVVQALIKPSDAMKNTLRSVGLEGKALTDTLASPGGLRVVMEKLREATGGQLDALVQLFPEIRAARGAFALMAADGENYRRAQEGIGDVNARAGATQRALNEQMKSASFQLTLAKNAVVALGIEVGQLLLPMIRTGAEYTQAFVHGISALPGPVKVAVVGLGLLTAAVAIAGGSFLLLAPKIAAAKALLAGVAPAGSAAAAGLGGVASVAGGVGVALTVLGVVMANHAKHTADAQRAVDQYTTALMEEGDAAGRAAQQVAIENAAQDGTLKLLNKAGVSAKLYVDAITGGAAEAKAFGDAVRAAVDAGKITVGEMFKLNAGGFDNGISKTTGALQKQREAYQQGVIAAGEKKAAEEQAGIATGKAGDAANGAIPSVEQLNALMGEGASAADVFAKAQDDLSTKLRQLGDVGAAFGGALLGDISSYLDPGSILSDLANQQKDAAKAADDHGKQEKAVAAAQRGVADASQRAADAQEKLDQARKGPDPNKIAEAELALERALNNQSDAAQKLTDAQDNLNRVRADGGQEKVLQLEHDLDATYRSQERAQEKLTDAQDALNKARSGPDAHTVAQAEIDNARAAEAMTKATDDLAAAQKALGQARTPDDRKKATQDLADAELTVREAQLRAADAQKALDDARSGPTARQVHDAELDVADAQAAVEDASKQATDQQKALNEARTTQPAKDLRDAENAVRDAELAVRDAQANVVDSQKAVDDMRPGSAVRAREVRDAEREVAAAGQAVRDAQDRVTEALKDPSGTDAMAKNLDSAKVSLGDFQTELARRVQEVSALVGQYVPSLVNLVNPILEAAGKPPIALPVGVTPPDVKLGDKGHARAKGGVDAHVVTSPTVLYGERETGGEAFIPRRGIDRGRALGILRVAADWYGAKVLAMANGGLVAPTADIGGGYVNDTGEAAMLLAYQAAVALTGGDPASGGATGAAAVTGAVQPGTLPGITGPGTADELIAFMRSTGVPFRVASTFRPGSRTHASGSLSYHAMGGPEGRAVDFAGPRGGRDSAELLAIDRAIAAGIGPRTLELIYSGPGGINLWHGKPHVFNAITAADHHDHVHVAMRRGGIVRMANGGVLDIGLIERNVAAQVQPWEAARLAAQMYDPAAAAAAAAQTPDSAGMDQSTMNAIAFYSAQAAMSAADAAALRSRLDVAARRQVDLLGTVDFLNPTWQAQVLDRPAAWHDILTKKAQDASDATSSWQQILASIIDPKAGGVEVGVYDQGGYLPVGWSLAGNFTGAREPVGPKIPAGAGLGGQQVNVHVAPGAVQLGVTVERGDPDAVRDAVGALLDDATSDFAGQVAAAVTQRWSSV